MEELINQIDKIIENNIPNFNKLLNEPATDEQLADLEKNIGYKIPDSFKRLYKWHNGQKYKPFIPINLITDERLLSLGEVTAFLEELFVKETWIPFTDDGKGNTSFIDVSHENFGSVIYYDFQTKQELRYQSLQTWIFELVEHIKTINFAEWKYHQRLTAL